MIRKTPHSLEVENIKLCIATVRIAKSLLVRNPSSLVKVKKPQHWKVAVIAKRRVMRVCLTVSFMERD